jgi:hypothetical protein
MSRKDKIMDAINPFSELSNLNDKDKEKLREGLSNPDWLGQGMDDMGADAVIAMKNFLLKMRQGMNWSERADKVQMNLDRKQSKRTHYDERPNPATRIYEAAQLKIAKTISGREVEDPKMVGYREDWTERLKEQLEELTETEGPMSYPSSLEELLKYPLPEEIHSRVQDGVKHQLLTPERVDAMLVELQVRQEALEHEEA